MGTCWPSVKCGSTIMGSSLLNDMDISRISLKSSYSCRMEIMPYISQIPAMGGWMEFPGAESNVNSLMTGSKITQCTSKLFVSTPVFPVVSRGAYIMGEGGRAYKQMYFLFLGRGV